MENAIHEWKSYKKLSVRKMAKKMEHFLLNIFQANKKNQITAKHLSGRNTVIPNASVDELARIIKTLSQRGFPLSKSNIQRIAFEFVTKNGMTGLAKVVRLVTFGLKDLCLATKNCVYAKQKACLQHVHQARMKVWS